MRRLISTVVTVGMLAASSAAASAAPPADPAPSCVALITSYEASQLAPGFVGHEVSGLATSGPGLGSALSTRSRTSTSARSKAAAKRRGKTR